MSQTERIVYALPFVPKAVKDTTDDPVLRQVAGYARVSTSEEEQQNSYEAQIDYYTNYIQSHEGWAFAGMYADAGSSYGQKPSPPCFIAV